MFWYGNLLGNWVADFFEDVARKQVSEVTTVLRVATSPNQHAQCGENTNTLVAESARRGPAATCSSNRLVRPINLPTPHFRPALTLEHVNQLALSRRAVPSRKLTTCPQQLFRSHPTEHVASFYISTYVSFSMNPPQTPQPLRGIVKRVSNT